SPQPASIRAAALPMRIRYAAASPSAVNSGPATCQTFSVICIFSHPIPVIASPAAVYTHISYSPGSLSLRRFFQFVQPAWLGNSNVHKGFGNGTLLAHDPDFLFLIAEFKNVAYGRDVFEH